jgi:hypothetical protein
VATTATVTIGQLLVPHFELAVGDTTVATLPRGNLEAG